MVLDAFTEDYDEIELFGKPALYTILKIDRDTVPPALNAYDIRHSDNGTIDTIEKIVLVNHMATVISIDPIELDGICLGIPCKNITYDDMNFIGKKTTLSKFMKAHMSVIEEKSKEVLTEQKFAERHRCKCGTFKGCQFEGEICPLCNTKIEERN